ncbi:MAG: glycosyltransferase [Clostridiales bacterium]|nr:glycosyltransferase [Candidatus Apopatousia equi]
MIITIVCDVLGEENNGTTIAAMNLIRSLKAKGHTVRILCADQNRIGEEGFFVVPNMHFGKLLDKYVEKIGVTLAKPVKDIIRQSFEGADIVHIMVPLLLGITAGKIARDMNIPITAGFHMQAENLTSYIKMNCKPMNKLVYKFIYRNLYSFVDGIHYPTNFIKNTFENSIKKKTPGYVISNGVHDYVEKRESVKPDELKDKFVILTTGRYAREKAQDVLIKAIRYSKYKDKIQLILGGQGIKERKYRKLAKTLPVEPIFKFFDRKEIIDVLNYSDMYVHPAEMELEGISCLEAIACGKLTIVSGSKKSATKEFAIDEKCIFKCHNPKDLARKIDYFIEHDDERKLYEQKYLDNSVVYSQDECMKKMEEMMQYVVKNHCKREAK